MDRQQVVDRVKNTGVFRTLANTPGWVWVVIGGVVLLIVGVAAASSAYAWKRHRIVEEE